MLRVLNEPLAMRKRNAGRTETLMSPFGPRQLEYALQIYWKSRAQIKVRRLPDARQSLPNAL